MGVFLRFQVVVSCPKKGLIRRGERGEGRARQPLPALVSNVQVAAHGAARSPLLLGPTAAPSAGLSFCPGVHPKSPLVGLSKKPRQDPRMSNVLCERASPAKELRTRLRSEKGGMCHLAEVMTHAAALLHLHRPSPRKCLRGGAPGAAWVAGRKKLAPALGSPAAPAPTGGGTAGSGCCVALSGASRRGAAGGCLGRGTLKRVSPVGLIASPFRLCALRGCSGVACAAPRPGAEIDGPPFCDRSHAARFWGTRSSAAGR